MYNVWITFAGGVNIAARVIPGSSGDINPEYVLRENPDVIIFTCNNNLYTPEGRRQLVVIGYTVNSTKPAKEALRMLVDRPGWGKLKAVREGRVYLIHHGLAHGHVFQYVALEWIAKWLHPGLFKDLHPLQDLRRFYQEYLMFPLRGVWAVGINDP
jgi:iron complex transport system substrate-binding protein